MEPGSNWLCERFRKTDISTPNAAMKQRDDCTVASERRDFPEWHRGRPRFAIWALALDEAVVDARLLRVRAALQPLLLQGYERQAHVTLYVCGFPVAERQHADDFDVSQLRAHIDAALSMTPAPVRFGVGAAFSFVSAACLAVHDRFGDIRRLRRAWYRAAAGYDTTPYVPHVTAGLYRVCTPLKGVELMLRHLVALPEISLQAKFLDWMLYDSSVVGGPLRTVLRVDLTSRCVRASDGATLDSVFANNGHVPRVLQ